MQDFVLMSAGMFLVLRKATLSGRRTTSASSSSNNIIVVVIVVAAAARNTYLYFCVCVPVCVCADTCLLYHLQMLHFHCLRF